MRKLILIATVVAVFVVITFTTAIIMPSLVIEFDPGGGFMVIEQLRTGVGDIPKFQKTEFSAVYPLREDEIVGNTLVSSTYGFEVSLPNTQNWIVIDDKDALTFDYSFLLYPGLDIAGEIYSIVPNDEGYYNHVLIFVQEENDLSITENISSIKSRIAEIEGYNVQEVIDEEKEFGIVSYNVKQCDFSGTDMEDCYTTLEVEVFAKADQTFYNLRAAVIPEGNQTPNEINNELRDIFSSFRILS